MEDLAIAIRAVMSGDKSRRDELGLFARLTFAKAAMEFEAAEGWDTIPQNLEAWYDVHFKPALPIALRAGMGGEGESGFVRVLKEAGAAAAINAKHAKYALQPVGAGCGGLCGNGGAEAGDCG